MRQVLITGASGLLGSNLVLMLRKHFEITAAYYQHPVHLENCTPISMDITRGDEARETVHRLKPDIVIHCAAETRVDYCEEHPDEAFRINAEGAKNLAGSATQSGAKFVYISTDSVFDGSEGMYTEKSCPHPLNVYAQTKLLGEQAVRQHATDHLIVRTSIYGWNARPKFSLAEWILDRLDRGHRVPGFGDLYFSPILVNDLAQVLLEMIVADLRGTYHVGARERCNKYSFARMLSQVFNRDSALIYHAVSDDAGLKACRPKDISLEVGEITRVLGRPMPRVMDGLQHFRRLLENGYVTHLRSGFSQQEIVP